MRSKRTTRWLGLVLFLVAGCAPASRVSAPPEVVARNGEMLNGHKLNGHKLNGHKLNGIALAGVRVQGREGYSLTLRGSELYALGLDGTELGGSALVGAELRALISDGSSIPLRIEGVSGTGSGIFFYRVSFWDEALSAWSALCEGAAATAPVEAIALAGRWDEGEGIATGGAHIEDPNAFTFACRGGALAKCAEWGYPPWQTVQRCTADGGCASALLAPLHQTCTRLVRADYCGDGRSWTVDGRAINLYDDVGIQLDTRNWIFEAEWTAAGAACISQQRAHLLEVNLPSLNLTALPPCILSKISLECGGRASFQSRGTLLMSEFEGTYVGGTVEP